MPKQPEGALCNSFVFSRKHDEFDRRNGRVRRSWPTSTKAGGFQPVVAFWRFVGAVGFLEPHCGQGCPTRDWKGEWSSPSPEHLATARRIRVLSFRPEPERMRRRSGGTCFSFPPPTVHDARVGTDAIVRPAGLETQTTRRWPSFCAITSDAAPTSAVFEGAFHGTRLVDSSPPQLGVRMKAQARSANSRIPSSVVATLPKNVKGGAAPV
jgi:hypothetical protein